MHWNLKFQVSEADELFLSSGMKDMELYEKQLAEAARKTAAEHMAALYSGFSVAHRPHGEKRDCQPNQCGHVHQRRVYPVPGSLRGGAELLVHVVGVPAGGAYAHHQGACAGRLDERPCG